MVRSGDHSYPCRIRRGFRVAVGIASPNGGNGSPKVVEILCVPASNQCIGRCRREHGEVSGILGQTEALGQGQRAPSPIPLQGRIVAPETGDVGLFWSSDASDCWSKRFDLVIVARPIYAGQAKRGLWTELGWEMQSKGLHEWGFGSQRGQKCWGRRHPNARTRTRRVDHSGIPTVVSTLDQDGACRLLADNDPICLS